MRNAAMMTVTLSTVYETTMVIVLFYLAKGWVLTPVGSTTEGSFDLTGNEAANLSFITGFIYIGTCGTFMTKDHEAAHLVNVVMLMIV